MPLQKGFHPNISGKSKTEPAISIQAIVWPISTTSQLQSVLIINSSTLIAEQPRPRQSLTGRIVRFCHGYLDAAAALWVNYESSLNVQKYNWVPSIVVSQNPQHL